MSRGERVRCRDVDVTGDGRLLDIDNVYVIIAVSMVRLHEYLDASGQNEYRAWFNGLDVAAATKVTVAFRPRLSNLFRQGW
jgi:hypothetical protein